MIACRDCLHCRRLGSNTPTCMHPKSQRRVPDFYKGRETDGHLSINSARTTGECGYHASLFEEREDFNSS